jgi:acetolactate synthase-1/2/3 large subunit
MGYAMAAGIGAKLGMPNKNVFVLAGDGAFAMNGFEIHTAVEMNIPVVWIIINNSGLGMIHQGEQMQFKGQFCTSKYQNSLKVTEIAKGLGADAIKISDPRDLSGAFATAVKATRPTVIEVMTSIEELAPMGRRMESLDTMFIKESKNAFPATRDN